jgi:hypothetical protein
MSVIFIRAIFYEYFSVDIPTISSIQNFGQRLEMASSIFCDIKPCSALKVKRRFGVTVVSTFGAEG